jgi:DNA-binding NarL/FixJ family response regulator
MDAQSGSEAPADRFKREHVLSASCGRPRNVAGGAEPASDLTTRHRRDVEGQSPIAIVVEKRPLIRDLLSQCLSRATGFAVITAASIDEGVKIAEANDAIIVLVSMAGYSESDEAGQMLQRAAQALAGTPIVILSDGEEPHQVRSALLAGARGYIPTSMSLDEAIGALWLVRAGGEFLPASCIIRMGHANSVAGHSSRPSGIFTVRQTAVVKAIRQGKPNKIIAYELKMKESTVKVHVRNIMRKLKAKNRTQVAYMTSQLDVGLAA